jgi:hypothetical protein
VSCPRYTPGIHSNYLQGGFEMSSSTIYRFSGVALFVGGLVAVIGQLMEISAAPGTRLWIPAASLALGGTLLIILGWPGLYLRQIDRAGRLGLLAFVLSFLGLLILVGIQTEDALISPTLAASAATQAFVDREAIPALLVFELLSGLLLIVGPFLYSIATIRASVLPRWVAILLMAGSVASIVTVILHNWNEVSAAILFVAIAFFGSALWSNREATEMHPNPPILNEAHN